jgi:hypothetical protein
VTVRRLGSDRLLDRGVSLRWHSRAHLDGGASGRIEGILPVLTPPEALASADCHARSFEIDNLSSRALSILLSLFVG